MSWKIFEGIRVKAKTLYEVHQFIKELQPIARKHLLDFNANAIAAKAYKDHDLMVSLGFNDPEQRESNDFLMHAFNAVMFNEEYHESVQIDNKFFIAFAGISKNSKYVLALPFLGRIPNLGVIIQEHPLVEEYPYWNNTDRDENVTAAEWNKRRKDWENVFGNNDGVPNHNMFMHQVADRTTCIPTLDLIKIKTPTLNERYADCVEVVIAKNVREMFNENNGDKEFNYIEFMDFYKKYRKEHHSSILKSIEGKLDENLTIDDLKGDKHGS